MKKFFLIFIIIFSLIGFVGCTQKDDTKSQFIKAFDIDIEEKDIELKEEFNDYGGFPYEGMALYKITLDEDAAEEFAKWESLPLSKKAGDFLTSVSTYIELPTIEDGYWKLVDRNPGTKMYTNVSFCVYDAENKCNLLEYLTQRDIQTKNSGVNVRYRGKHRFFKGFNEFIKEKTRRCDNDFEKIERHVFF